MQFCRKKISSYVLWKSPESSEMDLDRYDSIQLISLTEVIQDYYKMMKVMIYNAATLNKNKRNFDTFLCPDDELERKEFLNKTHLLPDSAALIDLIACLEWHNKEMYPSLPHSAVHDAILRLEEALKNSSAWEMICSDDDETHSGPVDSITEFEVFLLEENVPPYTKIMLNECKEEVMFFPLTNKPNESIMEKRRILEKLATLKITSQKTAYKEKVSECLKEKLQTEIVTWLDVELQKVKGAGKNTVLKDMRALTSLLKDLTNHLTVAADVTGADVLFFCSPFRCTYFDTAAETLESKLYPLVQLTMEHFDSYQSSHKNFHVNIKESSALFHSFYITLKHLVHLLVDQVKRPSCFERLRNFHDLFGNAFLHLLHVLKSESHFQISRAVHPGSEDGVCGDQNILLSTVIVLSCLCTVLDEWRSLEIEDTELCVAFLVKITDTICDGAKIFAEVLDQSVGNMLVQMKDSNCLQKICIVANSIEHVRAYLLSLPTMMTWEEILSTLEESENVPPLKEQTLLLLSHIHESMDNHLKSTINRIVQIMVIRVRILCEKFINPWVLNTSSTQNLGKLVSSLYEYLPDMSEVLKTPIYDQFLCNLWMSFLSYIKAKFQEGQHEEYAMNIKHNVEELHEKFLYFKMDENEEMKGILEEFLSILDLNSKTTEELQLDYYCRLAELLTSPLEYLGHLAFQAGYRVSDSKSVNIVVRVQKGQKIPVRKFDIDQLNVTVELCPKSMFPSQNPVKTQPVLEQLDNPLFNQTFEFVQLYSSVLSIRGTVIQLRVQNQDSTFCGEAVLSLNMVQNMSNVTSIDFLPVYLMPLRTFDRNQPSFQVLESRSKWDRRAKSFVSKRLKVTKSRRVLQSCVPRSYSTCGIFGNK